jgi:hypothetical protein
MCQHNDEWSPKHHCRSSIAENVLKKAPGLQDPEAEAQKHNAGKFFTNAK